MEHYLDNSATTRVSKAAAEKAFRLMTEEYGNPSSLHTKGFKAKLELDSARQIIAQSISAKPEEIYFTSGGTESNNLAVLGAADSKKRFGNKIVTTAIEHPSVISSMAELEKRGFEVQYIKPDREGLISERDISDAIDEKTILVSLMLVNNEVGSILPVKTAAQAIKRKKSPAVLHCDAVQAYGKIPVSVSKLGVDLLTLSGHKLHAPKGVGALYLAKNARLTPTSFGGGQEKGIRSGTESVPLIGAFSKAVEEFGSLKENLEKVSKLNRILREGLEKIDGIRINSPHDALPYILNFSVGRIKAETMLHFLAQQEIYVSSGSACGRAKPSHVLEAMNIGMENVASAIRTSFSKHSTEEDVAALLNAVSDGMAKIAHI